MDARCHSCANSNTQHSENVKCYFTFYMKMRLIIETKKRVAQKKRSGHSAGKPSVVDARNSGDIAFMSEDLHRRCDLDL